MIVVTPDSSKGGGSARAGRGNHALRLYQPDPYPEYGRRSFEPRSPSKVPPQLQFTFCHLAEISQSCFFFRAFKNADVPSSLVKFAPDFCNVYSVSKGKVQKLKSSNDSTPGSATSSTSQDRLPAKFRP